MNINESPKFNLSRFQGVITLQINVAMAESLLALMGEFDDLRPHEYALYRQLQNAVQVRDVA